MKWKDSDESGEIKAEAADEIRGGRHFSMGQESFLDPKVRRGLEGKKTPILVGGGLLLFVLLLVWMISGSKEGSSLQPVNDLEARVKKLEQRLAALESLTANGAAAVNQAQSIAQINRRIDGLESVFTKEIDRLRNRVAELRVQKAQPVAAAKTPAPKPAAVKPAPKPAGKPAAKRAAATAAAGTGAYHVVRPGENLYQISLQYGMKLKELLRLNNLKASAPIYPGQKLRVNPK